MFRFPILKSIVFLVKRIPSGSAVFFSLIMLAAAPIETYKYFTRYVYV